MSHAYIKTLKEPKGLSFLCLSGAVGGPWGCICSATFLGPADSHGLGKAGCAEEAAAEVATVARR